MKLGKIFFTEEQVVVAKAKQLISKGDSTNFHKPKTLFNLTFFFSVPKNNSAISTCIVFANEK